MLLLLLLLNIIFLHNICSFRAFHHHHHHHHYDVATRYSYYHHRHSHKQINKISINAISGDDDGGLFNTVFDKLSSFELLTSLKTSSTQVSSNLIEYINNAVINLDTIITSWIQNKSLMDMMNTYITYITNVNNNNIINLLTTDNNHLLKDLVNMISMSELSINLPIITIVLTTLFIINGNSDDVDNAVGSPYDDNNYQYDQATSDRFYSNKQLYILRRILKLLYLTNSFNLKLLSDYLTKNLERNEKVRAIEALNLITQLGPTFIKLGQALSIRTDLINEAYALELQKLQDAVTPFDSTEAKLIICRELKIKDLSEVFSSISDAPIASASIGQVYKGRLKNGQEVAVKVQRPRIIRDISLDLHILRLITPLQVRISNLISSSSRGTRPTEEDYRVAQSFVDEWGRGLVAEVDYMLEARNSIAFSEAMKSRGLTNVLSPAVVTSLSGSKVLISEWIDGTRLDKDNSPDVPRLCGIALNAYLTMLLDTGVLHCDPHPGNLMRTKDGRLCILDWGMTLTVPKDLQYAFLEFISHMNTENYEKVPEDFVQLGFSPPDKLERLRNSGVVEGFAFAIKQLSQGGNANKMRERLKKEFQERYGADLSDEELRLKAREEMMQQMEQQLIKEGVDIQGVSNMMEEVSRRNKEIFSLPTYVLYVIRAFSTLEGIGLSVDEDYAILQECYPYLAKRLFSDDSPRSREVLRSMLVSKNGLLSPTKLLEMSEGFSTYTSSTAGGLVAVDVDGVGGVGSSKGGGSSLVLSSSTVSARRDSSSKVGMALSSSAFAQAQEELVDLLLDPKGNMIQDILIETLANSTDSLVRDQLNKFLSSDALPIQLLRSSMSAPKVIIDNFIPSPFKLLLLPMTLPFTLPYDVMKIATNYIELDATDNQVIDTFYDIWKVITPKVADQIKALPISNNNNNQENNFQANTNNNNNMNTWNGKDLTTIPPNIQDLLSILNTDMIIQVLNNKKTQSRILSIVNITKKLSLSVLARMELRTNERYILNSKRLNLQNNNNNNNIIINKNKNNNFVGVNNINDDVNSSIIIQTILNKLVETTIKNFIKASTTIINL